MCVQKRFMITTLSSLFSSSSVLLRFLVPMFFSPISLLYIYFSPTSFLTEYIPVEESMMMTFSSLCWFWTYQVSIPWLLGLFLSLLFTDPQAPLHYTLSPHFNHPPLFFAIQQLCTYYFTFPFPYLCLQYARPKIHNSFRDDFSQISISKSSHYSKYLSKLRNVPNFILKPIKKMLMTKDGRPKIIVPFYHILSLTPLKFFFAFAILRIPLDQYSIL